MPSQAGMDAVEMSDSVGNLSAVSTYSGAAVSSTTCLVHDAASRLVAVGPAKTLLTSPGGTACQAEADLSSVSVRFEYDAWNRRAWRWDSAAGAREFVHDPAGHLLAEMRYRTTTVGYYEPRRDYVWLDGRPLAQLEYPGPAGRAEGYTYYFHLDHLGLPRALSNETKVSVWSATPSRPYGDVAEVTAVDPLTGRVITTELRLPGQYDERLLTALGIQGPYQNWHRWYLPTMGRYMELDPIALRGGFNAPFAPSWYGYAEGSPLRYVDWDASQAAPAYPPVTSPVTPPPSNMPMITPTVPWFARLLGALPALLWPSPTGVYPCENGPSGACAGPFAGPRKRGNQDPPWTKLPPWNVKKFNPGRGPGGDCNPCGPDSGIWNHDDGTRHQMQWDQDPDTCDCFSKREHLNACK